MVSFFRTISLCLMLSFAPGIYAEPMNTADYADVSGIQREKYKNQITLELGNENLVLGIGYSYFINRYHSLGLTLGYWLHPSGGLCYKFYPVSGNLTPYLGGSLMAYHWSYDEDGVGNRSDIKMDALGFYFPVGIQYNLSSRLVVTAEVSMFFSALMKIVLEKKLILEKGNKDEALAKLYIRDPSRLNFWPGIKVGYIF